MKQATTRAHRCRPSLRARFALGAQSLAVLLLCAAGSTQADSEQQKLKRFSSLYQSVLRQQQQRYKESQDRLSVAEKPQHDQRLVQQQQHQKQLQDRQRRQQQSAHGQPTAPGEAARQLQTFKVQQRAQLQHFRMQRAAWPRPDRRPPSPAPRRGAASSLFLGTR